MKTHDKQPQRHSRTLDSNPKAANQAPWDVILQRYASKTNQLYSGEENEELLQKKSEPVQRQELPDEDELLQGKFDDTIQQKEEKAVNNTGLPDDLKEGVENLSGFNMDDVRVHYNSDKPAQLNSLAYAQGTDIHIGPGQEKHLSHEAWHVVQQKQGRVLPTMQIQGVNINDNERLEKEADDYTTYNKLEKSKHNIQNKSNTIQRITFIRKQFNSDPLYDSLDKSNQTKLNELENKLFGIIFSYFSDDMKTRTNVDFELMADLNANISGLSPKTDDLLLLDPPELKIKVGIPLIKALSLGELIGIILHELNVHNAASYHTFSAKEFEETNLDKPHPYFRIKPSSDRQPDHVFAVLTETPRGSHYLNKTIEAVTSILSEKYVGYDIEKQAKESVDLICFYLFDVMRILHENIQKMSHDISDYDKIYQYSHRILQHIFFKLKSFKSFPLNFNTDHLYQPCEIKLYNLYQQYILSKKGMVEYLTDKHSEISLPIPSRYRLVL